MQTEKYVIDGKTHQIKVRKGQKYVVVGGKYYMTHQQQEIEARSLAELIAEREATIQARIDAAVRLAVRAALRAERAAVGTSRGR
jgi:hypothetical protein